METCLDRRHGIVYSRGGLEFFEIRTGWYERSGFWVHGSELEGGRRFTPDIGCRGGALWLQCDGSQTAGPRSAPAATRGKWMDGRPVRVQGTRLQCGEGVPSK